MQSEGRSRETKLCGAGVGATAGLKLCSIANDIDDECSSLPSNGAVCVIGHNSSSGVDAAAGFEICSIADE